AAVQAGGGSLTLPSDISEQIRRHRRLRNLEGDETAGLVLTHVNLPPETSALSGVVTAEIIIEGEKMSRFSSPLAVRVPISDGLGAEGVGCLSADGSSWVGTGMVTSRVAADSITCSSWHLSDFAAFSLNLSVGKSRPATSNEAIIRQRFKEDPVLALGALFGFLAVNVVFYLLMMVKERWSGAQKRRRDGMLKVYLATGKATSRDYTDEVHKAEQLPMPRGTMGNLIQLSTAVLKKHWVYALGHPQGGALLHSSQEQILLIVCHFLLLAAAQAIFYGTTSTSLEQRVAITLASTVIALPATLIFPKLLAIASVPPASATLKRQWRATRSIESASKVF
ncbi:unnamed protein product, partial [Chrysoparadoxa australica]